MARRAQRGEQVTVAELLVRSAPAPDGGSTAGTHARHREKPQVLRSLARLRVLSVVAGALALTGGVATAVSMPAERAAGAVWPPVGLEPMAVALVPVPAKVVVPPAPKSVTPPAVVAGIPPADDAGEQNSGSIPRHRAKPAKAVKAVGPNPSRAAPVRHEIPDVPTWSRGHPGGSQERAAAFPSRRDTGHHHGCGGGRHRR